MTPAQEEEHDIYLCRECEQYIGTTRKSLEAHITKKHVTIRTSSNYDIVTKRLYNEVKSVRVNHWREGLLFLRTHTFTPPTFRQTLITLIQHRLESDVLRAFYDVLRCCVDSYGDREDSDDPDSDFDMTPIWLLPFIFERLILAPHPHLDDDDVSLNCLIHRRLQLFRSGQIQLLFDESDKVESRTPADFKNDPVKVQKSAQIAADNDNFRTANIRLTSDMPVAAIDEAKLKVLEGLHPSSYKLNLHYPNRRTRGDKRNRKRVVISPNAMLEILGHLKRGKAPGYELDSLDIFIKLARRYRQDTKKKSRSDIGLDVIAKFFTILANGDVPPRILRILRTTYLVALHKDPTDPLKLRPLGIPSAIRRITAISILHMYKSRFAKYLLPFNFAFGIHGGVDFITTTLRLAVDKYMIQPEKAGRLPSRALVSLDIRNMFNAMSRQKARQIICREFPELEAFVDSLYADPGQQMVRCADGTWASLPVEEGFSQGCPFSPIFAALVLTVILIKTNRVLCIRAQRRLASGSSMDDTQGGRPITLGYVDDCNILLPVQDVELFLQLFEHFGHGRDLENYEPAPNLGAVLNTEKTRIMTTTSGKSVLRNRFSFSRDTRDTYLSLYRAITNYSRQKDPETGKLAPYEEVHGLRVLGAPIGSPSFCNEFILKMMKKALVASDKIANGLDSDQTIIQLFRTCTAHKMTHLFAADVLNKPMDMLPNNWHLWDSDMAQSFTSMVDNIISFVTKRDSVPDHALLIASMSTSTGGLGFQHPRSSAIPSFMLTTRRCIQYATDGVWIGHTSTPVTLPSYITSLYSDWESSSTHTFQVFRKYLDPIVSICVSEQVDDPLHFFMTKSSINTCRERLRLAAGQLIHDIVELELEDDDAALEQLEDLLEPTMSSALLDMSRLRPCNRRKNEDFTLMLKRKLRLELWPQNEVPICTCGKHMDRFGDHVMSCRCHCKTPLHNTIRDGLWDLFKDLFTTVRLTSTPNTIAREPERIVKELPGTRPFDISVLFDPLIDESAWRVRLLQLGFDVTIVSSKPVYSTSTRTARINEINLRLRKGEKDKFQRRGKTDRKTGITLTGDQIIGKILDQNMALLPIAVSPHGRIGSLFRRFLYGEDPMPLPDFCDTRPRAKEAARLVTSDRVPRGLLPRANFIWKKEHPECFYGGSYKAMDPWSYFNQQLGFVISTAISSHILRAHNKNQSNAPICCPGAAECDHCHFNDNEFFELDPVANPLPPPTDVRTSVLSPDNQPTDSFVDDFQPRYVAVNHR